MEFIGRDAEMAALQAEFAQVEEGGGRFAWVRGRRRVGKSRLVQEFCDRSDAPYAFFQAQRRGERKSIALFADAVARSTLPAACLLYTSDAADDLTRVDLGGRRII